MRSGNKVSFKNMGSSPAKDMKTGSYEHSFESPAKQEGIYKGVGEAAFTGTIMDAASKKKMNESKRKYIEKKKTKTLDDYLNEGFSQVEAEQMVKEGGVTGHESVHNKINKGRPAEKKKSPAKQKKIKWGRWKLDVSTPEGKKIREASKKIKTVRSTIIKGGKKIVKTASKRNPVILAASMMMGKTASADQPGTGTHGGKKQTKYNPKTGKYE